MGLGRPDLPGKVPITWEDLGLDPFFLMLANNMPLWHSLNFEPGYKQANNSQWAKCLRHNHQITTIGQLKELAAPAWTTQHKPRKNCACAICKTVRQQGCPNPSKCRPEAMAMYGAIQDKWKPTANPNTGGLTDEQITDNERAMEQNDYITLDPSTECNDDKFSEFRIFRDKNREISRTLPAREILPHNEEDDQNQPESLEVYIASEVKHRRRRTARAAVGIWYDDDDENNLSFCISKEDIRSDTNATLRAMIHVLENNDSSRALRINIASATVIRHLTTSLRRDEDNDWFGTPYRDALRAVIAYIRARSGTTQLRNSNGPDALQGATSATDLAKEALRNKISYQVARKDPPMHFVANGTKLSIITQRTAYRRIMNNKKTETRRQTQINLDIARECAVDLGTKDAEDRDIWKSHKRQVFPAKIKNFLWKVQHGAFKIGKWWREIRGYEDRGECHQCDAEEDMNHILTECTVSGQETVWRLVEQMWNNRGLEWRRPSLGHIMACNMANFRRRKPLPGANRLYAILVSEAAFLIWKLRCEWRIEHGSDPEKIPSELEITNRWAATINRRFKIECTLTNRIRFKGKALQQKLVEDTWWHVLLNRENLPDDWVRMSGVLVGTGNRRPPGRNR